MTLRTVPLSALGALLATLVLAPVASAHVTLNPGEWDAGGFARFALRVPTEKADASTTKVELKFPESVPIASFQPVPGWTRTVKMVKLATPITDEDGNQVTERIDTVTWEGGEIKPGEFEEFGISFQVPDDAGTTLQFPALQTYSDGDVVRWIGPESADEPAPHLAVLAAAGDSSSGATGSAETPTAGADTAASDTGGGAETVISEAAAATGDDDSEGRATLALVLAILGLVAGLAALGWVLFRPGKP
jgi:uncharacterized protein YcnI